MTTNNNRILVFSLAYDPYIGGAEIALKEITKRLSSYHFDIITARYSARNPKEENSGNLTIHRVGLGNKIDKYLFFQSACTF